MSRIRLFRIHFIRSVPDFPPADSQKRIDGSGLDRWVERERWKEGEKRCSPYISEERYGNIEKSHGTVSCTIHASQFLSIRQSISGYRYEEKGEKNADSARQNNMYCLYIIHRTNEYRISMEVFFFSFYLARGLKSIYFLFSHLCRDIF